MSLDTRSICRCNLYKLAMSFPKVLLLAILAAECYIESVQAWLNPERRSTLDIHNRKRANETACDMNALVYSMRLEEEAKNWTQRCVFAHQQYRDFGENIAKFRSKRNELDLAEYAAELWWAEKSKYNQDPEGCGLECGHYTQMAWAKTTEVGCYFFDCIKFQFYACYYWPPGNVEGVKPFTRKCDSKCREDQTEETGLCFGKDYDDGIPTTTEETTPPPTTTPEMTTTPPTTTTTPPTTTTTTPPTTTTTTPPTTTKRTTTPPPTTPLANNDCTDKIDDCSSLAAAGKCGNRRTTRMCKKTCNICG